MILYWQYTEVMLNLIACAIIHLIGCNEKESYDLYVGLYIKFIWCQNLKVLKPVSKTWYHKFKRYQNLVSKTKVSKLGVKIERRIHMVYGYARVKHKGQAKRW